MDKTDKLVELLERLNSGENPKSVKEEAQDLLDGEPHYKREEQFLFPAVEAKGVNGPTKVMVMEHEDLRRYKKDVRDLANDVQNMDFTELKNRVSSAIKILIIDVLHYIFS